MKFLLFFVALFAVSVSAQEEGPPPAQWPVAKEIKSGGSRARLALMEARARDGQIGDAQNLALFRFKVEQARWWQKAIDDETVFWTEYAESMVALCLKRAGEIAAAKSDAAALLSKTWHERAYIAPADGSAQPFWIYLPKNYSPQKPAPLVVFLHGYDPDISKAVPWLPGAETVGLFTDRGFILAVPYGRRNTDFLGVGEDDVLEVTRRAQSLYNVDANRTYLLGVSMGGYGVYAVGLHHPDVFAGLATMAARSDTWLWLKLDKRDIAPWKLPLYQADDPRSLAANAMHLPIFMQHGALDRTVPVQHSRLLANDLRALGAPFRLREIADSGHSFYGEDEPYQTALDWMKFKRAAPPRKISFTTASLRSNKSHWVEIGAFDDYAKMARINAAIDAGKIVVTTSNVARFTLRPPADLLAQANGNPPAPLPLFKLVINGTESEIDATQPIVWQSEKYALIPPEFAKNPIRSGPIRDCYRDPFLLVYGTQGAAKTGGDKNNVDKIRAAVFADEWQKFADGVPPMKADHDVSDDDRKNFNLILFGTRESNSVLNEIADKLPLELTPGGYRIGAETLPGVRLGLIQCVPSPFDARRMIVVHSGERWGAALPINHKFDLQPDYIVFTRRYDLSDGTNEALAAGFFDNNWQLPQAPAKEPVKGLPPAIAPQ